MTTTGNTLELVYLLKRANRQLVIGQLDAALASYNRLLATTTLLCGRRACYMADAHLGRAAVAIQKGNYELADDEISQASMIYANLGEEIRSGQIAHLAENCDAALYDVDPTAIQHLLAVYRNATRHLCTPTDETMAIVAYSTLNVLNNPLAKAS